MKDFNDFMKTLNSKDWSKVIKSIEAKTINANSTTSNMIANIEITTTLLKEYHNWLNTEKEN